jgi:RNA 2',3'-cyclic 3'-phosphodiesterase
MEIGSIIMRVFVAVDPSEASRERIAKTIERLRALAPSAKWVGETALHLTLAFLGEIEAPRVPAIAASLAAAASRHDGFDLGVGGGGTFGPPRSARVLWAGITAGAMPLGAVQREVASALVPHGHRPEARPFAPHLTLARARDPRGDPALSRCGAAVDPDLGTSAISALTLYESVSTGRGARYVALATLPFRPVI